MDRTKNMCVPPEFTADMISDIVADVVKKSNRRDDLEEIIGDYDLDRLRELVQADREGRCAILSKPMKPMVCNPNDTDVYCPNCGETLSGGWTLSDDDEHRNICQCPHCGQSIDENKCETAEAALKGEQHDT